MTGQRTSHQFEQVGKDAEGCPVYRYSCWRCAAWFQMAAHKLPPDGWCRRCQLEERNSHVHRA